MDLVQINSPLYNIMQYLIFHVMFRGCFVVVFIYNPVIIM